MAAAPHLPNYDGDTTIRETPGVMGGYPCIGMTRIPVRGVVEVLRRHGNVEAVIEYFPQLTRAQIEAGLAYYEKHPARVDEDTETNDRAYAELVARKPKPW